MRNKIVEYVKAFISDRFVEHERDFDPMAIAVGAEWGDRQLKRRL